MLFKTFGSLWSWGYTPQSLVRLMGPAGPSMLRSAMAKRFPAEQPQALEAVSPYLYQITAAKGSGEYALNLLLEPGAWARRPLCERLLPLQGKAAAVKLSTSARLPLLPPHNPSTVAM